MSERFNNKDKEQLIKSLNNFNKDRRNAAVCKIGMAIMGPWVMRAIQENRGIPLDTNIFLTESNIDTIEWYRNVVEFSMVYAICEQPIKQYIISNGKQNNYIKEDNINYSTVERK